ncbi:MAG: MBL fold metallo-hydrolase [Candidatus Neomarinimicrobiota bacterium]
MSFRVHSFAVGPFQENTYLVESTDREALFIDPGDEAARLIRAAESLAIRPLAIINTHAHLDHIGAVAELKDHFRIPFYLHRAEKPVLDSYEYTGRLFGVAVGATPRVDHWLDGAPELKIGSFTLNCLETPGHTPGGLCLKINRHVFVGDTLFYGSIGRTDLPGGSWEQLEASLVYLLQSLDENDIVHSGHGPDTSRAAEMAGNPFIRQLRQRIDRH